LCISDLPDQNSVTMLSGISVTGNSAAISFESAGQPANLFFGCTNLTYSETAAGSGEAGA